MLDNDEMVVTMTARSQISYPFHKEFSLKTESRQRDNIVVHSSTTGCHNDLRAASDGKVGILTTVGFQWCQFSELRL